MKRLLLPLLFLVSFVSFAQNENDFSNTVVILNTVKYDVKGSFGNPAFGGNLGTFDCNDVLLLNGFEARTSECGTCDVTSAAIFYRVTKSGDTPGGFQSISGNGALSSFAHADPSCLYRDWNNTGHNANLLSGLADGDYTLEVYFEGSGSGCANNTITDNNGGSYYSATFVVDKAPEITVQPIDLSVCLGNNVTFYTAATGSGTLTYQWQRDSGSGFSNLSNDTRYKNTTTNALRVDNTIAGNHANYFRCIVTDGNGCQKMTNMGLLTISRKSVVNSTLNTLCEGASNTLTATTLSGTVDSYQWQYQVSSGVYDNLTEGITYINTQNNPLTIGHIPATPTVYSVQINFRRIEMDVNGNQVNSTCTLRENETFIINPILAKPATIADPNLCGGGIVTLTALGTASSYRWYTDTTQAAVSTSVSYSPTVSATTTFYLSYINTNGCESYRTAIPVTIKTKPSLTIGTIPPICADAETFNIPFTNFVGNEVIMDLSPENSDYFNDVIEQSITSTDSPFETYVFPPVPEGTYNFSIWLTDVSTGCESDEIPFSVDVLKTFEFTTQPENDQVCTNGSITLEVAAIGNGTLSYQWYKNTNSITGATNASYTINPAIATDAGNYYCEVTDDCGTYTSNEMILTVLPEINISQQPQDKTACQDGTANFSIMATGPGTLSYQWKKGTIPIGTNSSTLSLTNVATGDDGAEITCEISSSVCGVLTSQKAILTVIATPMVPAVTSPIGYCKDATASILTATALTGNSLVWWGTDATDGTSSTTPPTPSTASLGTTSYYVSQKTAEGCEGPRAAIEVVIASPIAISISPSANAICATGLLNKSALLVAIPSDAGYVYEWSNSSGVLSGEVTDRITVNTADTYSVRITNVYCSATSNYTINNVLTELSSSPSVPTTTVCYNGSASLTATTSLTGGTFRWYDDATTLTALSSSNPLVVNGLTSNTTYYVAYQKSNGVITCESDRSAVNITVQDALTLSLGVTNATCPTSSDGSITATITSTATSPYEYKIGSEAYQTSSIFSGLGIGTYTITAKDALGCTGSNSTTVNSGSVPTISSQPRSIARCSGNTASFSVIASNTTSFQWQRLVPSGTWTDITGANSATLSLSNIGNTTNPHLTQYRVVVYNGTCFVTSTTATLSVNSLDGTISSQTACVGNDVTFSVPATTGTISDYQWQKKIGSAGTWGDITGEIYSDLVLPSVSLADNDTYYRCKLTFFNPDESTCSKTTDDGRLTVKQLALTINSTNISCNGASTGSITVSASGGTTPYTYQLNTGTFQSSGTFPSLSAGDYSVTAKDANGCLASQNRTITQPSGITISDVATTAASCEGATGSITITATGGTGSLMYQLNAEIYQTSTTFSGLSGGNYTISVKDENSCIVSQNVTVGGKAVPSISTHPQNQTDCVGNSVTFVVSATNVTSYQWQKKLSGGVFENISLANGVSLSISNVGSTSHPSGTLYRVVLQNDGCEIISQEAALFVNKITGTASAKKLCTGTSYTLNLSDFTLTGTVSSYTWQFRSGTTGAWTDLNTSTSTNEYILSNPQTTNSGYYRCKVIFDNGDGSTCTEYNLSGNGQHLTFYENTLSISANQTTVCGTTLATLTATGCNGTVFWSTETTGNSIQVGVGTYWAVCELDNCTSSGSNEIIILLGTTPSAPTISADKTTICGTETATLTATGCTATVVWSDNSEGNTFTVSATGTYYAVCRNECGKSTKSNEVVIGSSSNSSGGVIAINDASICKGNAPHSITNVTSPSSDYSFTIGWESKTLTGDWGLISGEVGETYTPTTVLETTLFRRFIVNTCGTFYSNVGSIRVTPLPSISTHPQNQTDCVGNSVTFSVVATNVTLYQWQKKLTTGVFENITSANSASLSVSNVGNASNPAGTLYRVVLQNDGCEVISNEASLFVNRITGTVSAKKLCTGTSYTLDLSDFTLTGTVASYTWQFRSGTTGAWTDLNTSTSTNEYILSNPQTTNSGYYRCKIIFDNGDGSTCTEYNLSGNGQHLTFYENTLSISANQTTVCGTTLATLTATGCNGTVKWSTETTGNSIQVGVGTYWAVCELDNCTSSGSNEITILLGTTPSAPTISADKTTICGTETATLTATGCTATVVWSDNSEGNTFMVSTTGTYYAVCRNECGKSTKSNEITIQNFQLPIGGTIQAVSDTNCTGYNPPEITNSTSSSIGTIQWEQKTLTGDWTIIDGATSATFNPSTLNETTIYRRKVTNACGFAYSNADTIHISPDPSVSISSNKSAICSNESFTLSANLTGGAGLCSVTWEKNTRSSASTSSYWEALSETGKEIIINNLENTTTSVTTVYFRAVYDCLPSSCNKATSTAIGISVEPTTAVTLNFADSTICEGNSVMITAVNCGGSLSWSNSETTTSITVSPTVSTSYTATCTNSCGTHQATANITVLSGGIVLPVNTTPSGVVAPAVLTFSAAGINLKWYDSEIGGIGSATAPSFSELGTYTYWVTQSNGVCESNRLKIVASIYSPLGIVLQTTEKHDCKGNSEYFSVDAVGAGKLTYQWQRKRPTENDFTNLTYDGDGIAFFYGPDLRVSNVGSTFNPHLTKYRCIVRDSLGVVISNEMTLYVNSVIGSFPNIGVCKGTNYNENLLNRFVITGKVDSYQWQKRPGTSGEWTDLTDNDRMAGTTTTSLQINNLDYSDQSYYRCQVNFADGACAETTDASKLTVSGYPPKPTDFSLSYCQFETSKTINLKPQYADKVIWYDSPSALYGTTKDPKPETGIAGSFKLYFGEITEEGCAGEKAAVTINVHPKPLAPANTTPTSIKEGTPLIFSAKGENLRWYTSRTGRAYTSEAPIYFTPKNYTHYVSQVSAFSCESERTQITATIHPSLAIQRIEDQADCDGNGVSFSVKASGNGTLNYQWEQKLPSEMVFSKIPSATNSKLSIADIGTKTAPDGTLYRCFVRDTADSLYSNEARLIVNKITGKLADVTLCEGQTILIDTSSLVISGLLSSAEWQLQKGSSWVSMDSVLKGTNWGKAYQNLAGDYRLKVAFKVSGSTTTCSRYTPEFTLKVDVIPTSPVLTKSIACSGQLITIPIKPSSSKNRLIWYTSPTDSVKNYTTLVSITGFVGDTTLYVSEQNALGCESERSAWHIQQKAAPAKPLIDSLLTICQFSPPTPLNATADGSLLWYTGSSDDALEVAPSPSTTNIGKQLYYVSSINETGCESEKAAINVLVEPCYLSETDVVPDACIEIVRTEVSGDEWIYFVTSQGKIVAAVHPNGLDLGTVTLNFSYTKSEILTQNGTVFLPRYYNFTSSKLSTFPREVPVMLFLQKEDFGIYTTENLWQIVQYDGINEDCRLENNSNFKDGKSVVIYDGVTLTNLPNNWFSIVFGTRSFSEFGITPNPYAQLAATMQTTEERVSISWQPKLEIRPLEYSVERSEDGENWYEVQILAVQSAYEITDYKPFDGYSRYRIGFRDKDGTYKYFSVGEVQMATPEPICKVTPNPVDDVHFELYTRGIVVTELRLINMKGQESVIESTEILPGTFRMNTPVQSGTYFIKAIGDDNKTCFSRLVVVK